MVQAESSPEIGSPAVPPLTPLRARPTLRRRVVAIAVTLGLAATLAPPATPSASADPAVAATAGNFTIRGAGYGHGYGLSQYGAYGAARKGLTWRQILTFYYPGTRLSPTPTGTRLRVWITADDDSSLRVQPDRGLQVRDSSGHRLTLPAGPGYTSWRISRAGSGYRLDYRTATGEWKTRPNSLATSTWSFSTTAQVVQVVLPGRGTRAYRGSVALVKRGTDGRTVNTVPLEDYLRAVVPAEMPTSWSADAVRAQAVAARSYAVRLRDHYDYAGYDICDTPACQVYGGMARENSGGDAAVKATAGVIVTYRGTVALTQFASSNGGAAATGSMAYLRAQPDPYDGVVASHAWTKTISAASVARAWPSVGTVRQLQVVGRDGSGRWGGRVSKITIIGSRTSVTVSGSTFQWRFRMRSTLYTVG